MTGTIETMSDSPSAISRELGYYRVIGAILSAVFAAVGMCFLFIPDEVTLVFNVFSRQWGMAETPVGGPGFFLILGVAYMYVVAYLAYLMYRTPANVQSLEVLIQAKSASSILSFLLFIFLRHYLIYLANGIIDGAIALGLLLLRVKWKGLWQ